MVVANFIDVFQRAPRRNGFIDGVHALRAFAAISVVVYHAGGAVGADKYFALVGIKQVTSGLDCGVDIFFVISGFVISLPLFLGKTQKIGRYVANRLLRIYPISILTALIFLGFGWLLYSRQPSLDQIASSILLLPSKTTATPVVLWTLKQELLFYAIFSLTFIHLTLGLVVVFGWSIASLLVPDSSVLTHWLFNPHNVQFAFGILGAFLSTRFLVTSKAAPWVAAISLTSVLGISQYSKLVEMNEAVTALMLGLFASGTVLGMASLKGRIPKPIMFLGTASYSIYLIHFFFVSFATKVALEFSPNLPGFLVLFSVVLFSVLAACIYYQILERPLENWRKQIFRTKSRASLKAPREAAN